MKSLTLDEAIAHALEVANKQESIANSCDRFDEWTETEYKDKQDCIQCAADHRQLAEWLTDYKELRGLVAASNVLAKDVLAVDTLCKQILEYKRLLKLALFDFRSFNADTYTCKYCKHCNAETNECGYPDEDTACEDICGWTYEDEALKLIGDSENDDR